MKFAFNGFISIVLMLFVPIPATAIEANSTEIRNEFNRITGISLPQPQHFSTTEDVIELDYSDFTVLRIQQQQNYFFIVPKTDIPLQSLAGERTNATLDNVNLHDTLLILSDDQGVIRLTDLPKTLLRKVQTSHIHLNDTLEIKNGVYIASRLDIKKDSVIGDLFYSQLFSKEEEPNIVGYFPISRLGRLINQTQNKLSRKDTTGLRITGSLGILQPNSINLDYVHFLQPASFDITEAQDRQTVVVTVPATMYVDSQTVKYDLHFVLEYAGNRFSTALSGHSNDSVKISNWQIPISNLTVTGELKQGKYTLRLFGVANLSGKKFDAEIDHKHGGYNDAVYELNIGKAPLNYFLSGKIKNKLKFNVENIVINKRQIRADIQHQDKRTIIHVFHDYFDDQVILFENPELSIARTFHINSLLLNQLKLKSSMIVYQGTQQKKTIDLNKVNLNRNVINKIKNISANKNSLSLLPGFTFFGVIDKKHPGSNRILRDIKSNDDSIFIKGELNEAVAKDIITNANSAGHAWAYNLAADIPGFSMQGVPNDSAFHLARLILSKHNDSVQAKIEATLAMVLNREHFQLAGQIDLIDKINPNTAPKGLLFKGKLVGETWPAALGIHWLKLINVRGSYRETLATEQKGIIPGLHILADINLKKHNTIPISLRFDQEQDSFGKAVAHFGGNNTIVNLSSFPHLSHITSVRKLNVRNLKLNVLGRGNDRVISYSAVVNNPEQVIRHVDLKLSNPALLEATEKADHHWDITIDGKATLNQKAVQYHAELDTLHPDIEDHFSISFTGTGSEQKQLSIADIPTPARGHDRLIQYASLKLSGNSKENYFSTSPTRSGSEQNRLSMTDILGIDNEIFKKIYPNSMTLKNGFAQGNIRLGENTADVISFSVDGAKIIAFMPSDDFSTNAIFPKDNWSSKGITSNKFIGFLSNRGITIERSDLPDGILSAFSDEIPKEIKLVKNMINVIGSLNIEDNSTVFNALHIIGIKDKKINLSGLMGIELFLHIAGLEGTLTDAMIKTLQLEGKILNSSPVNFSHNFWSFENFVFNIDSSYRISADLALTLGDQMLHGDGYFSLNNSQNETIIFNGNFLHGWEFPKKKSLLYFDDLSVTAHIEKNNQQISFESNFLLNGSQYPMIGTAKINQQQLEQIRFVFKDKNTEMTLGRIKPFQVIENSDQILLNEVSIEINFNNNDPSLNISGSIKQAKLTDFPGITVKEGLLSVIAHDRGDRNYNKISGEVSNGMLNIPGVPTSVEFKASMLLDDNNPIPGFIITLPNNYNIADLFDDSIGFSGFEKTELSSINILNDSVNIIFDHDGNEIEGRIFYPRETIPVISFNMATFPLTKVISESKILDGIEIDETMIIITSDSLNDESIKINSQSGFSKSTLDQINPIAGKDAHLVKGANVFSILETKESPLNNIFNSFDISDNVNLIGSFNPAMLVDDDNESAMNINLKSLIKNINIPGIPSGSQLNNTYFQIKTREEASDSEIYTGIYSELDLKVNEKMLSFAGAFNFSGDLEEQKVQFVGDLKNNWRPINWMQLGNIKIKAEIDHTEENTAAEIQLTGEGYLKTKKFDLEIDLTIVENKVDKISFDIRGDDIAVSDIEPLESIPRADKIQLSEIFFEFNPQAKETHFKADLSSSELIDFAGVEIDGGTFYADKTPDGWDVGIKDGKIIIHGAPLEYTAEVRKFDDDGESVIDFMVSLNGELDLQHLIGPNVDISSELLNIALESVEITRHSADIVLKFDKTDIEANIYKPKGEKPHISLIVNNFSLDELIPDAEILSDVAIDKAALIIILNKDNTSIDLDQVPENVRNEIKSIDGDVTQLAPGINMFSILDIKSGGQLESFFKTIGVKYPSDGYHLEIEGSFHPDLMFSSADKKSSKFKKVINSINLYASMDDLELPGLPAGSKFTNTTFHISGSGGMDARGQKEEGFFVGIGSDLNIVIAGDNHEFKGVFDFIEKDHETEIEFSGFTELDWHSPLGLSWITLKSLGISATIDKKKYNDHNELDFTIDVSAKSKLGNKEIDIDVVINAEFDKHNKSSTKPKSNKMSRHFEFYLDIKTDITAADIPILKNIPNASGFGLKEVIFASDGIVAKTLLNNVELDVAIVQAPIAGSRTQSDEESEEETNTTQSQGKGWLFIVEQQDGSLFDLIPGLGDVPLLKQIRMKEIFFVLATKNIRINSVEDVPTFARDIFEPVLEVQPSGFHLLSGIGLGAVFNPLEGSPELANIMGQIGISGESMIIGEIGGIFSGQPSLDLIADLPSLKPSKIKGMEFFSWVDGITPRFLIELGEEGLEVQLDIDMVVTINKDKLSFDGGVAFDLQADKIGFQVFGDFRGINGGEDPGWHNPLGLNGLTIEQLTLDCGFEEGALEFGLAGAIELNDHLYKVGTDVSIEFESVIPSIQGIGFNLQKDIVGPQELLDMLALLSGEQLKIDADQLPFLQLHDVLITFATPGMSNPNLGIVGPGAALSGQLTFLGQELGNLSGSIYPTSGIKLKGKIDPMNFFLLDLKENHIDFALVFDQLPHLNLKAKTRALFAEQDISIDILIPKYAKFDLKDSLGPFGEAEIKAEVYGLDFTSGRLLDHADIFVYGGIHDAHFFEWLEKTGKIKVNDVMNAVHNGIIDVEHRVDAAQRKVNTLNANIERERSIVRSERQHTLNWIRVAENNVYHLQDLVHTAEYNFQHCAWYAFWCRAQWGGEIIGLEVSYGFAEGVLQALRLGATLTPIDLDPRVAGLLIAHGSATLILKLARLSLEGFDALDRVAKNIIDDVIDKSYQAFGDTKINELSFKGSFLGYVKHHEPWFTNIDMELGGQGLQEKILFKPSFAKEDVAFNFQQIVPVSLHAIDVVLHGIENKIPVQFLGRILDEISNEIHKTEQLVKNIFAQHKFQLATLKKEQHEMQTGIKKRIKFEHGRVVKTSNTLLNEWKTKISTITDLQPGSQQFSQELIEVGHSGHCLKRAKQGVYVHHGECSDSDPNQKWSTVDLGSGYVAIQAFQRCLKPVISTSNAQSVKLILDSCDRGQQAQFWKVLSHDNDFFRFMNKTNGRCLHFQNPSAIPEQVEGEWWPCQGADSQVFRLIKNTKPVLHTATLPLYAINSGLCVQTQAKAASSPTQSSAAVNYRPVPAKALSCGSSKQQIPEQMLFDYVEDFEGYVKIYDRHSGQCLVGSTDRFAVSSPCNQSNLSFWRKNEHQGGFRLVNKATKQCLQLLNGLTHTGPCNNHADQVFSYGFPKQKIEWDTAKSADLRNVISTARRKGNKISIFNAGLRLSNGNYSNAEIICRIDRGNGNHRIGRLIDSGECLYAAYTTDYTMIKNKNSQLCFNIQNANRNNSAHLIQGDCASLDNQLYSLTRINKLKDYYTIQARHSQRCLDIQNTSKENKAPIWQWDCSNHNSQKWLIRKSNTANGYYRLISKHSEKCISVSASSRNSGSVLWQSDCVNQDNQRHAFAYPRAANFQILKAAANSRWLRSPGHIVPSDALLVGHYHNADPIYACRVPYEDKIYAGWAKDYQCHVVVDNKGQEEFKIYTQFEYLIAN